MHPGGAKKRQILYGLATYLPGVNALFGRGGGDSKSATYCYSVWMRHLVMARRAGLSRHPRIVAELGPGDTLGVGIAALISGAEKYYAFDVVRHADVAHNQRIFDELVSLFAQRAPIPHGGELHEVRPHLDRYDFPHDVLGEAELAAALDPARLARLRADLTRDDVVQYRTRWFDESAIERDSVDLVCSQAVLEHVDELDGAYRAMHLWLRTGGMASHQIDFRCHNTSRPWNGHWTISDRAWKILRGKRHYLLNREPYSAHVQYLARHGFELAQAVLVTDRSTLKRADLAPRFADLSDEDLQTCGALMQSIKR